jgi:photosystem II stability/assembly factor-like uncharacterized protein
VADWVVVGPGCGGALYRPTVSPASRDVALIACDMTGAYRTGDGGGRWRQLDFGTVARAFAFDPARPRTVWAGASGLFRSDDAGMTWHLVLPRPGLVRGERFLGDEADHRFEADPPWRAGVVEAVLPDPSDSRHLFVGVSEGRLSLLESRDRGKRFAEAAAPEGTAWVALLPGPAAGTAIAVTDAALLALGAGPPVRLPLPPGVSRIVAAAGGASLSVIGMASGAGDRFETLLFRSRDGGWSWDDLSPGLIEPLAGNLGVRFPCLAADGATLYLSVAEPPAGRAGVQPFGILKSVDGGERWRWSLRLAERQPENRLSGWVEADFPPEWGGAPFGLGVRPGDPDCCYATDWGTVYRTVDGGARWEQSYARQRPDGGWTNRGVNVTNVYGVHFDPFAPERAAMACTDVGLFVSDDGCGSWRHAQEGIPPAWRNTCYCLVFDPAVRGRAWSAWSGCHDLPRAKMLRTDAYRAAPGGVARTDDGMASWRPSTAGLPQGPVTHLDLDPASPADARRLLAAVFGHGVYASRDGGESWREASAGIGANRNTWNLCRSGATVWLLVVRNLVRGSERPGGLYRSDDDAESWQAVALPPGTGWPNALAVDPADPRRLYLACWPEEAEGRQQGGGLLASADAGANWERRFDESAHAYGVGVGADGTLHVCTFEGRTWRSKDGGRSWTALEGIRFKWQKTVQPDPSDPSRIFVSTFGAGLWRGPARSPAERPGPRFRVTALDVAPGGTP